MIVIPYIITTMARRAWRRAMTGNGGAAIANMKGTMENKNGGIFISIVSVIRKGIVNSLIDTNGSGCIIFVGTFCLRRGTADGRMSNRNMRMTVAGGTRTSSRIEEEKGTRRMRMRRMRRMVRKGVGVDGKYDTSHTLNISITIVAIIHHLGKTQWGREATGHDNALRAGKIPRTPQKRVTGLTPPRGEIGGARPDTASAGSLSSASSRCSSSISSAARTAPPRRGGVGRTASPANRPQLPAPQSVMAMAGRGGRILAAIARIGRLKRNMR